MAGFAGKVPDLRHEARDIWEAAEQEDSMQLYPNLAQVLWKRFFDHFPVLESLSDRKVNVLL
jgi:hypothetical protein